MSDLKMICMRGVRMMCVHDCVRETCEQRLVGGNGSGSAYLVAQSNLVKVPIPPTMTPAKKLFLLTKTMPRTIPAAPRGRR